MEKKIFTIIIYTENQIGLLNRITVIFTRRHINIDSLSVSECEIKGVSRFTVVINEAEEKVKKVVGQIEKQIEVIKAFFNTNDETIYQEIALYKISTKNLGDKKVLETIVTTNNARIVTVQQDYLVIEKTGHEEETKSLFDALKPLGVMQFVRSGRVAVTKNIMAVSDILKSFENQRLSQ